MNSGSRLWIISDEMSISMLTKPSTQIPEGIRCKPSRPVFMDSPAIRQ